MLAAVVRRGRLFHVTGIIIPVARAWFGSLGGRVFGAGLPPPGHEAGGVWSDERSKEYHAPSSRLRAAASGEAIHHRLPRIAPESRARLFDRSGGRAGMQWRKMAWAKERFESTIREETGEGRGRRRRQRIPVSLRNLLVG